MYVRMCMYIHTYVSIYTYVYIKPYAIPPTRVEVEHYFQWIRFQSSVFKIVQREIQHLIKRFAAVGIFEGFEVALAAV